MTARTADTSRPVINPDGVSVKGCKYIYAPSGEALEYAPLACNPYRGCGHKCAYCYVPKVLHMDRGEFDRAAVGRQDFEVAFLRDVAKYQAAGVTEQVMLSFTTDPYHPGDTSVTRWTLEKLAEHGMAFCTLTKGGTRALRDIDLFRPERDAFASTLTSLDRHFSMRWESRAAEPDDRIAALRAFHDRGIFTWVSLEPTLDAANSLAVVEATHGFVDLYKVGRANYIKSDIDWRDYTLRMLDVLHRVQAAHYIKKDLQQYLPDLYPNPLRVPQHH
jgi:DNA repair photolyase